MNSRPMNITHFVENLNRGGLERVVLELVKLQHQQGHRCQVVCLFKSGSLAHELTALGIPVGVCDKRPGLDLRALVRARRIISSVLDLFTAGPLAFMRLAAAAAESGEMSMTTGLAGPVLVMR